MTAPRMMIAPPSAFFATRPDHQLGLDGKDEALVLRISFGNHRIVEDIAFPDKTGEVLFHAFHVH
jgi:hypothetical protein